MDIKIAPLDYDQQPDRKNKEESQKNPIDTTVTRNGVRQDGAYITGVQKLIGESRDPFVDSDREFADREDTSAGKNPYSKAVSHRGEVQAVSVSVGDLGSTISDVRKVLLDRSVPPAELRAGLRDVLGMQADVSGNSSQLKMVLGQFAYIDSVFDPRIGAREEVYTALIALRDAEANLSSATGPEKRLFKDLVDRLAAKLGGAGAVSKAA